MLESSSEWKCGKMKMPPKLICLQTKCFHLKMLLSENAFTWEKKLKKNWTCKRNSVMVCTKLVKNMIFSMVCTKPQAHFYDICKGRSVSSWDGL